MIRDLDITEEFRKLRDLVNQLEATMDGENKKQLVAKLKRASAALKLDSKKGRPKRAPVVDWPDVMVIANLGLFGGSIRKAVKAHYEAGLLPHSASQDAHRVRIESRLKETHAASQSNATTIRKKK